ncbi:MAG: EAL and HDOD domain-containing protein [Oceanidesulfovibrio sp.]
MTQEVKTYHDVCVVKQPVFTRQGDVWGFELLYRDDTISVDPAQDNDLASLAVTAAASFCTPEGQGAVSHIVLSFSPKSIRSGLPEALPASCMVIAFSETHADDPAMEHALRRLAAKGYPIAVEDFRARPGAEWLLSIACYLSIDMRAASMKEIMRAAAFGRAAGKQLLAKRVENLKARQLAETYGCSLFQGCFFKQPEIVSRRTLNSHESGRLRLLKLMECEDLALDELAEAIRADVGLSYKLVNYLNSPFFGLRRTIGSVEQAVTLIGWRQTVDWLRVIIMADFAGSSTTRELAFVSVQRARFLELSARSLNLSEDDSRSRFLLGLFSLLDVMLCTPMDELLEPLNLEAEIVAALMGEENEAARWLGLALSFENGDWKGLDAAVEAMRLDPAMVAGCYSGALDWTSNLLMEMH